MASYEHFLKSQYYKNIFETGDNSRRLYSKTIGLNDLKFGTPNSKHTTKLPDW